MNMRHLPNVLDEVFAEIPDDFELKETVSLVLGSIKESATYSPPEMKNHWWNIAAMRLNEFLGDADEDWKLKISEIINGDRESPDWKQEGF